MLWRETARLGCLRLNLSQDQPFKKLGLWVQHLNSPSSRLLKITSLLNGVCNLCMLLAGPLIGSPDFCTQWASATLSHPFSETKQSFYQKPAYGFTKTGSLDPTLSKEKIALRKTVKYIFKWNKLRCSPSLEDLAKVGREHSQKQLLGFVSLAVGAVWLSLVSPQ